MSKEEAIYVKYDHKKTQDLLPTIFLVKYSVFTVLDLDWHVIHSEQIESVRYG
ncbi:MAG: hypothetical protein GY928_39650 [Colwellia sp.]|nr:hypothetical protein [Colwellia sp.]